MLDFSVLRSHPDNGLATDRLSRHLALIFPKAYKLSFFFFVFIELKARH